MAEAPQVDVYLGHDSTDDRLVEALGRPLEAVGLTVRWDVPGGRGRALEREVDELVRQAKVVVVLLGPKGPIEPLQTIARLARSESARRPTGIFLSLLPGADETTADKLPIHRDRWIDLRGGMSDTFAITDFVERIRGEVTRLPAPGPAPAPAPAPAATATTTAAPPSSEVGTSEPVDVSNAQTQQTAATKQAVNPPVIRSAATKQGAPAAAPREFYIADIFDRLDDGARWVIDQADAIRRRRKSGQIHMEDLIVGLYRQADGPTHAILAAAGVTEQELTTIVAPTLGPIRPGATLTRVKHQDSAPPMSSHVLETLVAAAQQADVDSQPRLGGRELLAAFMSIENCSVAAALRDHDIDTASIRDWEPPPVEVEPTPVRDSIAGFRSDEAKGPDLLGIGSEVDAIATVLAARSVEPPLALGLFGDWGTGKTFFMNELEERIQQLADEEAKQTRTGADRVYCRHIVQLRFNAWHYIERDLWASLASAIFEQLDEAISHREMSSEVVGQRAKERAVLLLQRVDAQQRLEVAEHQREIADAAAAEAQAAVERVEGQVEELADAVRPEAILAGAVRVAAAQPEVRDAVQAQVDSVNQQVEQAAKTIGIEPDTLKAELAGSSDGGYLAAWRALLHDDSRRVWLPLAAFGLVAVAAAIALELLGLDAAVPGATLLSLLVGVGAALRPLVDAGRVVSRVLVDARAEGRKLIEEQREQQRNAALEVKASKDADVDVATEKVDRLAGQLDAVDVELAKLRPGREMANFVQLRRSSSDYKSRLGVVAQARDDFEELSRLLARDWDDPAADAPVAVADGADTPTAPPAVERIVLYIDDLDRCKEKEVVAVLQAVHLLLAFRLFVVVVAVDPRWLLHSLRVQTPVFAGRQQGTDGGDDDDALGWAATPLNYLEKIFQIPFALRPMGSVGFRAIIDNLVGFKADGTGGNGTGGDGSNGAGAHPPAGGRADTVAMATPTQAAATDGNGAPGDLPEAGPKSADDETLPADADGVLDHEPEAAPPGSPGIGPPAERPRRPVELNPRALDIDDAERTFMARMHPLVGTPRAAKRFVNVYRLLKASHPAAEQDAFVRPEVHRPVLLLLAILTGYPEEAADVLRLLVEDEPDGLWWPTVIAFAEREGTEAAADPLRANGWEQLGDKLAQVRSDDMEDLTCEQFGGDRARSVARYSFESSRILFIDPPSDEAATDSP